MLYIQFYTRSALDRSKLVEGCGDRSVYILDGRSKPSVADALRRLEQLRRVKRWDGFAFCHGRSLLHSAVVSPVYKVAWVKPEYLSVPREGEGLFPVAVLPASGEQVTLTRGSRATRRAFE